MYQCLPIKVFLPSMKSALPFYPSFIFLKRASVNTVEDIIIQHTLLQFNIMASGTAFYSQRTGSQQTSSNQNLGQKNHGQMQIQQSPFSGKFYGNMIGSGQGIPGSGQPHISGQNGDGYQFQQMMPLTVQQQTQQQESYQTHKNEQQQQQQQQNQQQAHTQARKIPKSLVVLALAPSISTKTKFAFEPFLRKEYQFGIDPSRPVCKKYVQGRCELGNECPDKHVIPPAPNSVVCKHWLRGLCKKGDACEFLHEYNLRKMPECTFYSRNGFCTQSPDCLYLHIDPQSRIPLCPNYERGFCKLGPECTKRHVRRTPCELYLAGFCPSGPSCEKVHPKWSEGDASFIRPNVEAKSGNTTITPYHQTNDYKFDNSADDVVKVLR
ncbi:uncharacterized protein V1516DRAFT_669622 [Lipomyces oligophaga]|uniref:uncharacterized protein n=1 Tax=Lipomyces oligophaga TaxID=45792 RepID=UPI0034CE6627